MSGQVCWILLTIFFISVGAVPYDDDRDDIVRPCDRDDLDCIRKFFASRRHCTPPRGRVPDPYLRDSNILNFIDFNMTVIDVNSHIRGLNGKINEFHLNKRTNQMVFAVSFKKIDVATEKSVVYHHRKGQVPIVTSDWSRVIYRRTLITTTTPLLPTIDFRYTVVSAYSEEGNPAYGFGPGIYTHPSPIVQKNIASYIANPELTVRNALATEARSFIRIFVQNVICGYNVVFINKNTSNLIMTVNFKAIRKYNEVSDFYFHRVGKEPLVTSDFSNVTYGPTIITAVIPFKHGLDLQNAMITSYITDGNPSYTIGPRVYANPDPDLQNVYGTLINDTATSTQEAFFTEGPFFFRTFLQYTICDFGIREN
ncbi:uncharacterized protein LOC131853926 [Achroia grisella]|uniref:uncharacterized protein LOC131853926 n=1 Tax=Achroia grisella TaxID=688607 RepID=UPI0027D22797|nr:uncharacterized protein LOC131853926 [Achroia grisella]